MFGRTWLDGSDTQTNTTADQKPLREPCGSIAEAPEVLGTIAGDDTILLAVRNAMAQRRILREVRRLATT